jgi:hypothetical protein
MAGAGFRPDSASASLARAGSDLISAAWAPTTSSAYGTARSAFIQFWNSFREPSEAVDDFADLPASASSDAVMTGFVTWLAKFKGLAPRSIESYRAGVDSSFRLLDGRRGHSRGPSVSLAMAGISRLYSKRQRPARRALSSDDLQRCWSLLSKRGLPVLEGVHSSCLLAVLFWLFFGVFRISELVWSRGARRGIRLGDVSSADASPVVMAKDLAALRYDGTWVVELDKTKTDQGGSGRVTAIGALGGSVCPARALSQYLSYRRQRFGNCSGFWTDESPLFLDHSGEPLSDCSFHQAVRLVGEEAGLPGGDHFLSHSGRIGGASAAEAAGASRSEVMLAGGWKSDPSKLGYVRSAVAARVELQRAMVSEVARSLMEPSRSRARFEEGGGQPE